MEELLRDYLSRAKSFEREKHLILSRHEAAPSRVILVENTSRRLSGLSLRQEQLFREALGCTEYEFFRAAHVMAWAAFIDFLENKVCSDFLGQLRAARPKWKFKDVEELREKYFEHQILDACDKAGLLRKSEVGRLKGELSKRHACAHPSGYSPDLNETLGYVAGLIRMIEQLQKRKP